MANNNKKLITLRDILYIFFKNKVVISLIFLIAVLAAVSYCIVIPPEYRAETKILIKMGKAQIAGMEQYRPEQYNILFQERSQNIRNEMELLKGEYLTERVVSKLRENIHEMKLKSGPMSWVIEKVRTLLTNWGLVKQSSVDKKRILAFMDSLRVNYIEDTDMIRVSFDSTDRNFAALVANTYADEYVTLHTMVYETQRSYKFYIEQIELSEKKLRDIETELQNFISKSNIANIELQKEILLKSIGDLTNRYNLAMVDSSQARTKLSKVRDMAKTAGAWIETPETMGASTPDKQAYLRTLDDSFFRLKQERERLLKTYTPKSNEIRAIDVQLAGLRQQKKDSLTNIINMELSLVDNKRESLQREIGSETKKLEDLNGKTLALKQLQRARDLAEANYQIYKKKAEDLRISDDLDARRISSVRIATPAIPPLEPAYPRKGMIIGLAAFIGLFFGFGISAVREFFNHTFKDEDSVHAYLGVPLLLSVPKQGVVEINRELTGFAKVMDRIRVWFGIRSKGRQG